MDEYFKYFLSCLLQEFRDFHFARELPAISEATSSAASLSDLTDPSTPLQRHSCISSTSSASAQRLSKLSMVSLRDFWSETTSIEEAEILSLYSGERSPSNTMERQISGVSPLVLDISATASLQDEPLGIKRLSKSDQQLPLMGLQPDLSPKQRFKSEPHINCVVETQKEKHGAKQKRFKRLPWKRQTAGRICKASIRTRIAKWVRRGSQQRMPPTKLPQQSSSEHNSSSHSTSPETLPVLELNGEPVATSASGTNLFYFSFVTDTACSSTAEDQSIKSRCASPDDDGTSLASGEWLSLEDGADMQTNPPEYRSYSVKKTISPSASSGISVSWSVDHAFSEDQSQNSLSLSQTDSQDGATHCQSCSTGEVPSGIAHVRTSSSSSTATMPKMNSAIMSQGLSRVSSPCSTGSSGYLTWSQRSSQGSLTPSESTYSAYLMPPEEEFDYHSTKRVASVKRHYSMPKTNQIRNTSPLVRERSSSMHK